MENVECRCRGLWLRGGIGDWDGDWCGDVDGEGGGGVRVAGMGGGVGDVAGVSLDVVHEFVEVVVGVRLDERETVDGIGTVGGGCRETVQLLVDRVEQSEDLDGIRPGTRAGVGDHMQSDLDRSLAERLRERHPLNLVELDKDCRGVERLFLFREDSLLIPKIDMTDNRLIVLVKDTE